MLNMFISSIPQACANFQAVAVDFSSICSDLAPITNCFASTDENCLMDDDDDDDDSSKDDGSSNRIIELLRGVSKRAAVAIIAGIVVLVVVCCCVFRCRRKRRRTSPSPSAPVSAHPLTCDGVMSLTDCCVARNCHANHDSHRHSHFGIVASSEPVQSSRKLRSSKGTTRRSWQRSSEMRTIDPPLQVSFHVFSLIEPTAVHEPFHTPLRYPSRHLQNRSDRSMAERASAGTLHKVWETKALKSPHEPQAKALLERIAAQVQSAPRPKPTVLAAIALIKRRDVLV